MASIRISQLAEVTSVTNDDVFVVNDGDINTRKITYSNLISGLVPKVGNTTITGNLTISGSLIASDLNIASGFLTVDEINLRLGIGTNAPEQALDVNGNLQIRGGNVLRLNDPNNSYAVTLQTPVLTANTTYAFPSSLPSLSGQVLSSTTGGVLSWETVFTDPMSAVGDMVVRNASNLTARLSAGGLGQVLTIQGDGVPDWQNPTSGFTDPMTNAGDIILKDATNVTTRLGIGTANQVLTVNPTATALTWAAAQGAATPSLDDVATVGAVTNVDLSVGNLFTVRGDGASADGAIKLNCSQNSHGVTIQAPPHSASATYTLTLPNDDGTTGQVLSTDGSGVLSWTTNSSTSTASTFTWDATILPDTNEAYDLGSASYKVRHLFLSDNSIKFESGDLGVAGGELTWKGTPFTPASTPAHQVKPVVSAVQPVAVNQGEQWSATQGVDADLVNVSWSFYNYTGPGGEASYNRASSAGTIVGIENTPGTYTVKARAAWPFGISDEVTLTVQVNTFSLNRNTMFGGIDGLQGWFDYAGTESATFIALTGAAVDNGAGAYVFDVDGSVAAEAANCIAFYDYTLDVLYAFRITALNAIEGVYRFATVSTLPTQGYVFPVNYATWLSYTSQKDAAIASSVLGKRLPHAAQYTGGVGSQHYLVLTPSANEYDTFGASSASWSYGFRLEDDWMASGYGNQMLAPGDDSLFFLNTVYGMAIGSSPYEGLVYGDNTAGPYSTSSNGASWDIATANWKIANAGDLVVVTFDGASTGTWKLYVEGTLIFSSSSVDTYMSTTSNPTKLEFGNFSRSNGATNYLSDYEDPSGWYSRLYYLFVSVGTAFSQAQVTEMTADKGDLTASDNYAAITTLGTFTTSGITNTKGSITYTRGDFSF